MNSGFWNSPCASCNRLRYCLERGRSPLYCQSTATPSNVCCYYWKQIYFQGFAQNYHIRDVTDCAIIMELLQLTAVRRKQRHAITAGLSSLATGLVNKPTEQLLRINEHSKHAAVHFRRLIVSKRLPVATGCAM